MLSAKLARSLYRLMLLQRRVVEAEVNPTGLGSRLGQEAVGAAVCTNLRRRIDLSPDDATPPDIVVGPLSGLHYVALGLDLKEVLAERFGKATGYCKGKGGSVHISAPHYGLWGRSASLGGDLPIAAGAAWGAKASGLDQIVVCGIGDGSVNEGRFHEAMNLAQIHKLPILWVYENNNLAHALENSQVIAGESIAKRVQAYGTSTKIVDGNDVLAMYQAARRSIRRIRSGNGPVFLECRVTRMWPETETEFTPEPSISHGEVKDAALKDPIKRFGDVVLGEGLLTESDLATLESEAEETVQAALAFAQDSPYPDPSALEEGLFAPPSSTGTVA